MLTKNDLEFIDARFDAKLDKRFAKYDKKWEERFENFTAMIQREFLQLHREIFEIKEELILNNRRFEKIEHKVFNAHERRFDVLEDDVRKIKTKLNLE